MALTGTLNLDATPPTLMIVSDRRDASVTVRTGGEELTLTGSWPVLVTDPDTEWVVSTDDGITQVLHPKP